jgi:hypothetical protein
MIERNGPECKYIEIFANLVGSIGAPSRRTIIQFNSIQFFIIYVPTAVRPITDTAQCKKKSSYILDKST